MNRSWFRLPFGNHSSHAEADNEHDEDDEEQVDDSGELLPSSSSSRQQYHRGNRRSKTSNSSGGRRAGIKQSISRPFPSPLATNSDTASYATAQASSIPSECSTAGSTSLRDEYGGATAGQPVAAYNTASTSRMTSTSIQNSQHAHTTSLHSISSIRTAHFVTRSEQLERLQRSTTPDGSMEVSPSKTPLRDRLNRLSIASTASGMVNFDDEDREEAERRWLEEEEEAGLGNGAETGSELAQVLEEQEDDQDDDSQLSSSEDEMGHGEDEYDRRPQMTPSRSSTSVKSILKKSIASAEGIPPSSSSANASIHATPHRTVTWSPSTLPPAKSPPATDVSPEHPRGPLAAAEAYLLNLGQRQQDEYYQGMDSPYRRGYSDHREDESIVSSEDSAMEIEEVLLSRSSTSISPHNLSTVSDAPEKDGAEASNDSLKILGSGTRRGAVFMDCLKGLIPSPESSFADTQHADLGQQPHVRKENRVLDPSMSNILDTSAPMHTISQDITVNEPHLPTARQVNGPKPFLLRQSVILEESSILDQSADVTKKASTSPTTSPDKTTVISMLSGRSFITTMQASPAESVHTPVKQASTTEKKNISTSNSMIKEDIDNGRDTHDIEIFETPAEEADPAPSARAQIEEIDAEEDGDDEPIDASPSPSLRALPSITPSSSSSSLIKVKPESPFTSLVNHLLSTQDELLSHRADQKTMLISLVSNLRGELASRDRQLDLIESQKKSLERNLKREKEERENEKVHQKDRITTALAEVEAVREKLSAEVKRRDDALREELLHERTKRELVEKQLESLRRNNDGSEEIEYLRHQLQDMREALDEQRVTSEQTSLDLKKTQDLLDESRRERENAEMRVEASQRAQEDVLTQADMLSEECDKLRKQATAAEKQVSKLSSDFETQMTSLRTKFNQSESTNAKLRRELEDVRHALQEERLEQTRQYDMGASVQESLRIDNDKLSSSVARLERSKEHSFQQLQMIKKDTAAVLAQKEERIAQLEAEVLKRSFDRRSAASPTTECTSCKEASERNGFLESEVVRLREIVGKMRMESADREVKIARLHKTREQLKEDIDGLNIALEAKQQEVAMLKRESHRLSGGADHTQAGLLSVANATAGGISMTGTTTSTARPHSRVLSASKGGRPSSLHDATAGTGAENGGLTMEQRRRSVRARPTGATLGSIKRVSVNRSSIDTPSVLSAVNANAASGNVLNSTLTSRRTGSKDLNTNAQHDKALEAASLVKPVKTVTATTTTDDKENIISTEAKIHQQKIRELPSAPNHAIVDNLQRSSIDIQRGRSGSLAAIEAR